MECSCNLRPGDLFPGLRVADVCLRDNHYYYGLVCRAVVAFLPAVRFKVTRARLSSLYSRSLPMRLRLTEYYIHYIKGWPSLRDRQLQDHLLLSVLLQCIV